MSQKKNEEEDEVQENSSKQASSKSAKKVRGDAVFPKKKKKKLKRKTQTTQNTTNSEDRATNALGQHSVRKLLPPKVDDKNNEPNQQPVKKIHQIQQPAKKNLVEQQPKTNQPLSTVLPVKHKRFSLRAKKDPGNMGQRHQEPLIMGLPFWHKLGIVEDEKTEIGAEMIIDHELIDLVAAGTSGICPKKVVQKTKFDAFSTMDRLKLSDDYFFRDNIVRATASSVLVMGAPYNKQKDKPKKLLTLEWSDKVTFLEFYMKDRKFKGSSVLDFVEDERGMAAK